MRRVEAGAAGLALSCVVGTAWAADSCARAQDLTALQVAAVQQQLMVAAFACNDISLYNQFVVTYRDELQSSDQALQAFFVRMDDTGGMAEYHTFKTKMANVYSLRSNADKNGYCRNARASFDAALTGEKRNLASFALAQPIAINEPYTNCGPSIAGAATIAGAKPKTVAAKAEVPAAQAQAPDEQVAIMAPPAPTRSPIQKVMPLPAQDPAPSSEEPMPPQDAASGEPLAMIAAAAPPPEQATAPAQEIQPPRSQPDSSANAAQAREARPPAVNQDPYAGRNGAPQPRTPQNFTAQRRPPPSGSPPPYRYGPNYYAGSPYGPRTQYPYSYYYDRYGRLVPYYYRAPYPPPPYRANQNYYDDRANSRALERAPYQREDPTNRAPYRSEGDRAPDDRGFYDDDNRYGTVPPQRY